LVIVFREWSVACNIKPACGKFQLQTRQAFQAMAFMHQGSFNIAPMDAAVIIAAPPNRQACKGLQADVRGVKL